ncbi:MAG: YdcF family protein [Desulfobacteraceae bacterium]|nr:YdcF family protein [Desulfobacteraceae bacterium]
MFFLFCITFLQAIYYHYIYYLPQPLEQADAVVVFYGGKGRAAKGYELLNLGYAKFGIFSPAKEEKLYKEKNRYELGADVSFLVETKARTTYENALYTSNIITSTGLSSVILVTSRSHMPRSYFLLKCLLIGKNIPIQRVWPAVKQKPMQARARFMRNEKALLNEMTQLWGSLIELGYHKLTGKLLDRSFRSSKIIRRMEDTIRLK